MKKIKFIAVMIMVIFASAIYPDIQSGFNNLRNSYRDGRYISILKSSSEIIDGACAEIINSFNQCMPGIENFVISNSFSTYNFSSGDGLSDYAVTVEKTFTNNGETAVMTLSSSPFDAGRYDSLISGYENLGDKGDYERFTITENKYNYSYIIDNFNAYYALIIEKNNNTGDVESGLLLKINFTKGAKSAEKKRIIENCIRNFISRLRSGNYLNLLK
jgi:hypothetical protein